MRKRRRTDSRLRSRAWLLSEWGKPAQELRPGDVVNIPVGVKHWHGAAPDSWFSHPAVEVQGMKPPMNGWKPWTTQYILR